MATTQPPPSHRPAAIAVGAVLLALLGCTTPATDAVALWPIPAGGRLPQALLDTDGTTHLVYFQGEGMSGDLWYATRRPGDDGWSAPVRVNSENLTVTGAGPIDGGQIALGRDGRLHVAWFDLSPVTFFYTRTELDGGGFEPQFGLASGDAVEAAPTLVADEAGAVLMFWHSGAGDEATRRVYLAASRDDGTSWTAPRAVNGEGEGACNCCGLAAVADDGGLYVSYRGARDNHLRGQRLLTSRDDGETFTDELIDPWELNGCPVTTSFLAPGPQGPTLAWETQGQVHFAPVGASDSSQAPAGEADSRRKNPAVAVNRQGETLLTWSDGPGFRSGGTLHWQLFDADRQPVTGVGGGDVELAEGSRPIALALADGSFAVVF